MPIYEYRCASCGHITKQLRGAERRNKPAACEQCGHPARVILSASNFDMRPDKGKKLRRKLDAKQPKE